VIARVGLALVLDLSDIKRIAQDRVEVASAERECTTGLPMHEYSGLGPKPKPIDLGLHFGDGAQSRVRGRGK
jgi:hypothetical protein